MTSEMYGIFDTVDRLWMGDEAGPKLFEDQMIAQAAAQIVYVRLGHNPGRYQARLWQPVDVVRLRDSLPTLMDSLEALTLLERGQEHSHFWGILRRYRV